MSGPDLNVHPQLKWRRWFARDDSAVEGSRNCACAVGAGLVEWATRGAKRPTHHEFRLAAGNPKAHGQPLGLSSAQLDMAYKSFGVDSTRRVSKPFSEVRQALRDGHAISACIDYAYINHNAPDLSGQKTFMTGHHVALLGFTANDPNENGQNTTTVYDPLFDGRTRAWGTAPRGPKRAPLPVYRGAMGDLRVGGATYATGHQIGDGFATFLIIKQAAEPADNPDEDEDLTDAPDDPGEPEA